MKILIKLIFSLFFLKGNEGSTSLNNALNNNTLVQELMGWVIIVFSILLSGLFYWFAHKKKPIIMASTKNWRIYLAVSAFLTCSTIFLIGSINLNKKNNTSVNYTQGNAKPTGFNKPIQNDSAPKVNNTPNDIKTQYIIKINLFFLSLYAALINIIFYFLFSLGWRTIFKARIPRYFLK